MSDTNERSVASAGSVAYRTFDDWYSEIEGFSLRGERLDGPVDELRAAFAAGQSGLRLTDAEREALNKMRVHLYEISRDNAFIDEVCDDAKAACAAVMAFLERHK